MNWYAAHAIMYMKFKDRQQEKYPLWENILLIAAESDEEALAKAVVRAKEDEGDSEGTLGKKGPLTKILAIAGTLLVCFAIVTPILTFADVLAADRVGQFDYLTSVGLFPFAVVGALLLVLSEMQSSLRAEISRTGFSLVIITQVLRLGLSRGVAAGVIELAGLWWALAFMLYAVYFLALVALGVCGVLLLRESFKGSSSAKNS